MAVRFSNTMLSLKPSDIGPLLAIIAQPDIISFAGGLPAPQTFPLKELTEVAVKVREEDGAGAMQYGPSQGYMGLRKAIADRMNRMYVPMGMAEVDPKNIIVVTGSQQGLDMTGRIFLDKDDVVLIESPSYMGAIDAFALNRPRFIEVPTDDQGMIPEELEKILQKEPKVKFIYLIPNYQNPTGICMSFERRKKFMDVVTRYDIPVFEDNPYGDLRFEGEEIAPLISMDPKHLVIYSGTFSKTLCPGMRLAWLVARDDIMKQLDRVKGSTDLATPSVTQREVAMYMTNYDFEGHVQDNCRLYAHRRDVMCNAIDKYFPAEVKHTYPHGGLFLWVELPEGCDSRDLFKYAIEKKVVYVPGDAFFPVSGKRNFFRLNYSYTEDDVTEEGIRRLTEALKEYLASR
ncbi:PLP-dependent aminotransferase family protein [Allisonella histaminiformans]|uniref:aminotransferase-like domain-containing protein n=1 Tax=Allisonella histaminiformans TaxID=209880 RepID=UPI002E770000|nr:PLP-dependent aminotransferase family protein [Allisonella histaminiformans]